MEDSEVLRTEKYNSRLEYELFLDRDMQSINRSVYNIFMFLGDIGGLVGILFSLFSNFLTITNVNDPTYYMVSKLYDGNN